LAAVAPHDLNAYELAVIRQVTSRVVLAPAWRWRVLIEGSYRSVPDLLMRTVIRLRAAGATSPIRQADLLQLPIDLVEHLNGVAQQSRWRVEDDGALVRHESIVRWVYRDVATDEIWQTAVEDAPPLPLLFRGRRSARLELGSAGKPWHVLTTLLDESLVRAPAVPTPTHLGRLVANKDWDLARATIIGEGEPCLVACPLAWRDGSPIVLDPREYEVHGPLTQKLVAAADAQPALKRFLNGMATEVDSDSIITVSPLGEAVNRLRSAHRNWNSHRDNATRGDLVSAIDRALHRYCHQAAYDAGTDSGHPVGQPIFASQLARFASIPTAVAVRLSRAEPASLLAAVSRLLVTMAVNLNPLPGVDRHRLPLLACELSELEETPGQDERLARLARQTADLCEELIRDRETGDGYKAE
jgi:hypothetical protein